MTAQEPDTVCLDDGERLAIAGVAGPGLFDPAEHRLVPARSTQPAGAGTSAAKAQPPSVMVRLVAKPLRSGVPGAMGWRSIWNPPPRWSSSRVGRPRSTAYHASPGPHSSPAAYCSVRASSARRTSIWKFERVVELLVDHERRQAIEDGHLDDPDGSRDGVDRIERTFTLDYVRTFG